MSGWERLAVILTAVWIIGMLLFGALMGAVVVGIFAAVMPPLLLWGVAWVIKGFRDQ